MSIVCSSECRPLCDFCKHCHDHATGFDTGTCVLWNRRIIITHKCDFFYCFNADNLDLGYKNPYGNRKGITYVQSQEADRGTV